MKLLALLFCVIVLSACGGGYNPDKAAQNKAQSLGSTSYFEINPGAWRMADSLGGVSMGANFELSFSLEDGGSVVLHTFANSELQEGFDVRFSREGAVLRVEASSKSEVQNWSDYFSSIDARGPMTFSIDVHNQERPAHVLIWGEAKNSSLNHRNTLYNTAEDSVDLGFAGSPGNGSHRQWGISFSNANITSVQSSTPQENH